MELDDASVSLIRRMEDYPKEKPHCCARNKRCIIITLTIVLLLLLVLVLLGVFVIIPAVAQGIVAASKLSFQEISMSNISESSVFLESAGVLANTGPFSATLQPTVLALAFNSSLFGTMPFPQLVTRSRGRETPFRVAQQLAILSDQVLLQFAQEAINAAHVVIDVSAVFSVNIFGLTLNNIKLDKRVSLRGMRGFPGVNITSFELHGGTPSGGVPFSASVAIVSDSQLGMALGNVALDLMFQRSRMGAVVASDMRIHQGMNFQVISGLLQPENVGATEALLSQFLRGEPSATSVKGVTVAQGRIPWLERLVQSIVIDADLPGATSEQRNLLHDVVFERISLKASGSGPLISSDLVARLVPPFPIRLQLQKVKSQLTLSLCSGPTVGTLDIPWSNVSQVNGSVTLSIRNVQGDFSPVGLTSLTVTLLDDASFMLCASGPSSVVVDTDLGVLTISGFPLPLVGAPLTGLNGTVSRVSAFDMPGQTASAVNVSARAELHNPSVFSLHLGRVEFALLTAGPGRHQLGTAVASVVVRPGRNTLQLSGLVQPRGAGNLGAAGRFVSAYLGGRSSLLSVEGLRCLDDSSEALAALVRGIQLFARLRAQSAFPLVKSLAVLDGFLQVQRVGTGLIHTSMTLDCWFASPWPQVDLRVQSVAMEANETLAGFGVVGQFTLEAARARLNHTEDPMHLVMRFDHVRIRYGDWRLFAQFDTQLFQSVVLRVGLQALANISARLPFGEVPLVGLPVASSLSLKGVNSFRDPPIRVDAMTIVSARHTEVHTLLTLSVFNAADLGIRVPHLEMYLQVQGVRLGVGVLPPDRSGYVTLERGWNTYAAPATVFQTVANRAARQLLFSNFISGVATPIVLHGGPNSSHIPVLQSALATLDSAAVLPGLGAGLIVRGDMQGVSLNPKCRLTIANPFNVTVRITQLFMKMSKGGINVAQVASIDAPIVVPARATVKTLVQVHLFKTHSADMLPLQPAEERSLALLDIKWNVLGWIDVEMGDGYTEKHLTYAQTGIPVCLVFCGKL